MYLAPKKIEISSMETFRPQVLSAGKQCTQIDTFSKVMQHHVQIRQEQGKHDVKMDAMYW